MLRDKLRETRVSTLGSVATYLTKITQMHDELVAVGEKVEDRELVRIALNDFTKSWEVFVNGVITRENLPKWQCIWDDFIWE